jgi:hypothetical protein
VGNPVDVRTLFSQWEIYVRHEGGYGILPLLADRSASFT